MIVGGVEIDDGRRAADSIQKLVHAIAVGRFARARWPNDQLCEFGGHTWWRCGVMQSDEASKVDEIFMQWGQSLLQGPHIIRNVENIDEATNIAT